jgi:hypothetical protein
MPATAPDCAVAKPGKFWSRRGRDAVRRGAPDDCETLEATPIVERIGSQRARCSQATA